MLQSHFPYAACALLIGSLGAGNLLVTLMCAMVLGLWLPLVYGSTRLGADPPKLTPVRIKSESSRQSARRSPEESEPR